MGGGHLWLTAEVVWMACRPGQPSDGGRQLGSEGRVLHFVVDAVYTWASEHLVDVINDTIGRLNLVSLHLSVSVDDEWVVLLALLQAQPLLGQGLETVLELGTDAGRVHRALQDMVPQELQEERDTLLKVYPP